MTNKKSVTTHLVYPPKVWQKFGTWPCYVRKLTKVKNGKYMNLTSDMLDPWQKHHTKFESAVMHGCREKCDKNLALDHVMLKNKVYLVYPHKLQQKFGTEPCYVEK